MNKSDRDELLRLARARARLAKSEAAQREKVLLAEAVDLMTAEFEARDKLWAEASQIAQDAASKANDLRRLPLDQEAACGALRRSGAEVGMTRAEVESAAGLTEDKAWRALDALVSAGIAKRADGHERGKPGRWRLVSGEPPQTSADPPQA